MNEAGSVLVKFEADTARFRADLEKIKASMGGVETKTKDTASVLSQFRGVLVGFAGLQVAQSIGQTALELDSLAKGFRFATGSAEKATEELTYVREVADELGVEFLSTAKQYAGLSAAARGTALEGQKTRDVFYGITAAASAMGKSSADTAGILNAVQQMMSKGTVSAEELRGQMGERMWGAFQQAAQAIGLTTQELGKQLELGNVMADQLLPLLADRMRELAEEAGTGTGLQAELNRLSNTWTDLVAEFANSGGIAAATVAIQELTRWTKEWQTVAKPMIGVIQEIDATLAHLAGSSIPDFFPKLRDVAAGAAIALDQVSTALRGFREWFNADNMETFSKSVQVRIPKGVIGPSDGAPRVQIAPSQLATEEIATGDKSRVGAKPRASAAPRRGVLGLLDKTGTGETSAVSKAQKEAARDAEQYARAFEALNFELSKYAMTVERASYEEELRNNLQSAGVALDSARGSEIALLTQQIWANKEAVEAQADAQRDAAETARVAQQAQQEWGDIAKTTIRDLIQNFGDLNSVLGNLLSRFADAALDWGGSGGSGGGVIGSLLSDAFGISGRAGGGPVNRGQPYMVGERGPELFVPSAAGRIQPRGFGGGQSVVINQSFSFEAVNAATVTMLRNEAGKIAEQVRKEVVPLVVNAQRRNQMAGAF